MVRFLPPLIGSCLPRIAPSVGLRAVPLNSRHFELKLETGEADLAFGASRKARAHLRRQRLFFDGYVERGPQAPSAGIESQSRASFLAERHILVTASETGHAAHGAAQRALSSTIDLSNIMLRVPSFVAGAIVAAETDGIATLPANLANRLAGPLGLTAFETPIALPRIEISQYWHERYHRDPAHRWIRSVTFELFAGKA